jgi:hypothetical protein
MITNLLLKFSSKNKTSKLTLSRTNGKSVRQAARHTTIDPGVYLFDKVIEVHESHPEVQGLIGKKVLMFRRQGSTEKVYIYAGPSNAMPLQNCIAVVTPDFMEIAAGLAHYVTTLEVQSAFMLFGTQPLQDEVIPPTYRHLFRAPLESFEEPSEEAKRRDAQRRAEEQARRTAAEEREAARRRAESDVRVAQTRAAEAQAAAEARARREAEAARQAREQQRIEQERQRAARQHRPATQRPPAQVNRLTGNSARPSRSTTRHHDDEDTLGDFMFMSMFPEVAPMYRPNSFMAWYLWSQSQENHHHHRDQVSGAGGQFDGGGASGNWEQGVPGFPEAASQRVSEYAGIKRVDLLDESGRNIGSFTVTEKNGQAEFLAPGGHAFTVTGDSNPTVEYANEAGKRFFWDGENEPVVDSVQDSRPETQSSSVQSFFDAGDNARSEDRSNPFESQDSTNSGDSGFVDSGSTRDDAPSQELDSSTSY